MGYTILRNHLMWVADYKHLVITDDILMRKWLYVGSHLPKEVLPDDVELRAKDTVQQYIPEGAKCAVLHHDTPLSPKQFEMLLAKAVAIHEAHLAITSRADAKSKLKPSEEMWLQHRQVIQRWEETISLVAKEELSAEDFEVLRKAVEEDERMDGEIMCVINRRPPKFFLAMLPSCGLSERPADEAAGQMAKARSDAASAKLRVFKLEMEADWEELQKVHLGSMQLRELLAWLELEHRRQQIETGQRLVARRMAEQHPVIEITAWDQLAGQLKQSATAWSVSKGGGKQRTVLWIDFNTPHSRDNLRLPAVLNALATCAKVMGEKDTVVLAWMPNCSKEGSNKLPEEDEQDIQLGARKVGFVTQLRVRMLLTLHPSVANKTSEMDWWVDGRIMSLGDAASNFLLSHSELARTRRVMHEPSLPLSKDLVSITSMDENEDVNSSMCAPDLGAKCAQRGPYVAEIQLSSLLHKVPLEAKDQTLIVDLFPHVGDRALGTHLFIKSGNAEGRGGFRHVLVKLVGSGVSKSHARAVTFAERRVSNWIAKEWLSRSLVLHDATKNAMGVTTETAVYPVDTVPPPTEEQLRTIPGAYVAWKGLDSLSLKTMMVRGTKVKLSLERLAEFEHAPLEVLDELEKLKATHAEQFESLLSHLASRAEEESNTALDARNITGGGSEEEVARDLVSFESEEKLREATTIVAMSKASEKDLVIFKDNQEMYYLMSKSEDREVCCGTQIGGVGGGNVVKEDPDLHRCWPFQMTKGDSTLVQLAKVAQEGDDTRDKVKPTTGTLFSILRNLEAQATSPPKLTSYGQMTPTGVPGRHQYSFEFPEGDTTRERLAFVPTRSTTREKTLSAANMFASSIHRDTGVGEGPLGLVWRLNYDPVGNVLKPAKPHVVTFKKVSLTKGAPVRVAWPVSGRS